MRSVLVLMIATLVAAVCFSSPQVPVVWTGGFSSVNKPEVKLITTVQDWVQEWARHEGRTTKLIGYGYDTKEDVPEVDFKSHVILALYGGEVFQHAGFSILETNQGDGSLTVRYLPRYFSVVTRRDTPRDAFKRTPYAFVLLPRNFELLKLEEGILEDKRLPITKYKPVKEFRLTKAQ